jgi:hypothetical protein
MTNNSIGWVPCGGTNPPRFKSHIWLVCYIFTTNYSFTGRRRPLYCVTSQKKDTYL